MRVNVRNKPAVRRAQNRKFAAVRAQNAQVFSGSIGAGQRSDTSRDLRVDNFTSHPLDRTRSDFLRARTWTELYYKEWAAKKIIDIPVQDMLRKPWKYDGLTDDQSKVLTNALRRFKFPRALRQALKLERLVGGAVILIGLKSEDESEVKNPIDLDNIQPGDVIFTNVVPRTKITVLEYDLNPLSPRFGKPMTYRVWQHAVHASRMMIFDGDPLVDNAINDTSLISASVDGFGVSVLSPIYDDIVRSISTRQSAMQLIHRASVMLINNGSLKSQLSSSMGQEAIQRLEELSRQMSIYQAGMIDGRDVTFDQWTAQFGSVPQLLEQFLQIISAASDIPATRFLGQAPGGLNATGRSDLENYYNNIEDIQESRLRPQLDKFMQMLIRSELPNVDPDSVQISFEPLWNPSELEESQQEANYASALSILINSDIMSPEQGWAEAKHKGLIEAHELQKAEWEGGGFTDDGIGGDGDTSLFGDLRSRKTRDARDGDGAR